MSVVLSPDQIPSQVESAIHTDGVTDGVGWESMTLVSIRPEIIHFRELSCQSPHPDLSVRYEKTPLGGAFSYLAVGAVCCEPVSA